MPLQACRVYRWISFAVALVSCSIGTSSVVAASEEEWRKAVLTTYDESQVRDEGNGTTSFGACFRGEGKGCGIFAFGRRDGFSKVRSYTSTHAQMSWDLGDQSLLLQVRLPDCEAPPFMLRTHYFPKEGWLFIRKVAVMADGQVVLEKDFSKETVQRGPRAAGIEEEHVVLSK